ncbi:hypothetical protein AXF42_Ash018961 [Apostasia shenzhenica]|uniref:C2 NT-type domain-containing protein n=1 Tax=Apostasia shenzhenica TaxID=1088818 RepID=A0A2I0B4M6_9ASPA|nr:hypothetical protein AXF42_Ash018961 [Apostasia shenzhenica]
MFKLNRHRSDRLGERLEFKLSNIQAFKVPKGWDKLFVSVVSNESGKTIAKSNKATVRSGTCQWTDSLSESIPLYQDGGMKELEESFLKIVISMGSGRPNILGEVVLNLADYIDSSDASPLTLPLNKCNSGTILQVKVQCFNPKNKFRDGNASSRTNSRLQGQHAKNNDNDGSTDMSDGARYKSVRSTSSNQLGEASSPEVPLNKDAAFYVSGSNRSSGSAENSIGKSNLYAKASINGSSYMGRQDSSGSHVSGTSSAGPGDDLSRSNQSSFNSRASGSSTPHHWQEANMQAAPQGNPALSLGTAGSARELLEAAEETIDELRDEAKMWERHAQKLKIDLEKLKKECSFKSKQHSDLDIELSAVISERDSLRREVEQLRLSIEELKITQKENDNCKTEVILKAQRQLEDELKFLKESNNSLTIQLNKSQEANLELVAILEELEETVERQRLELANSAHSNEGGMSQMLKDMEAEWAGKLSAKEDEINKLEEKLYKFQDDQLWRELESTKGSPSMIQEIEDLKAKLEELERDCIELTEENLELLYKLKESSKDVNEGKGVPCSLNDISGHKLPDSTESEISQLKSQISQLKEELRRRDMDGIHLTESSAMQIDELNKKCTDLEIELQHFKDQAYGLDVQLCERQVEAEERILQLHELQENLSLETTESSCCDVVAAQLPQVNNSRIDIEMPKMLCEINKQLQLAKAHVKNLNYDDAESDKEFGTDFMVYSFNAAASEEEFLEDILNDFINLNSLLDAKIAKYKDYQHNAGEGIWEKKSISSQAVNSIEVDVMEEQQNNELCELKLRNQELEVAFSLKEKEIDALRASMRELEEMISNIKREKYLVEETLAVAQRDNSITSKSLQDVRSEILILSSSVDSHLSANKILEEKSSELEISKRGLEAHIAELEIDNSQLSESISGLESQLRCLTEENKSGRLEIEGYKSLLVDLKGESVKQQSQIKEEKVEQRKSLQEVQKQLSEAQEEFEFLKKSHSNLQSSIKNLTEECNSLQKQTEDLKKQKLEMHEHMSHLELELGESQKKNYCYLKEVELLEAKFSSLHSEMALKEESLASQLENLLQEHKDQDHKLSMAYGILKEIHEEKTLEVENLKHEIAHLSSQMCSSQDERERLAAEALREVSNLRLDKNKLESSLQEFKAKVKFYESELHNKTQESENKVEGLVNLLNTSKHSEEMLMSDIVRMQKMIESIKSNEENYKRMANELELRLKACDYEKQQVMEDISNLKDQLQKVTELQHEILRLESSLEEAKSGKQRAEYLLHTVSEECEEVKTEKASLAEKISNLFKALHGNEDDRHATVALEEKLRRLESNLFTREVSFDQAAGMKNEINHFKRNDSDFRQFEERPQNKMSLKDENVDGHSEEAQLQKVAALESNIFSLQTELAEVREAYIAVQMQLNGFLSEKRSGQTETPAKSGGESGSKVDQGSRIFSLEAELKEMRERYLHMSLQYAEVEAQREELVMQLKSAKKEKRWFS